MGMLKPRYFIYLVSLLALSACQKPMEFLPYEWGDTFINPKIEVEGNGYHKSSSFGSLTLINKSGEYQVNSYKEIVSSGDYRYVSPSLGDLKALIIPINFLDSDTSKNERQRILIQNAFLGNEKTTNFESLTSYYYKSSYGQLKIDGFVSEFYNYPLASTEINGNNSSSSKTIAGSAIKWFYESHPHFDITPFDKDGDGYLDLVYFVYNKEVDTSSNNVSPLWWAFVDSLKKNESYNTNNPYLSSFCWISTSFLEGKNNKVETHALIHETGHMFGLLDYYNTYSSMNYQPTGYVDMMDRNLGDHTALSKMFLNWTTPYVVNESTEITLKPFNSSGDLLLIPTSNGWNNTPYDEYLILEYYTPYGLNKYDAGNKYYYTNKDGKRGVFTFLNRNGLKVYHVNARLAYFQSKINRNLIAYQNDPEAQNKLDGYSSYCVDLAYSNSILDSRANLDPVLYHLLEVEGNNTFINNNPATNNTLWKSGDTFGVDTFTNIVLDDNADINYTFEVTNMNSLGVTIRVTKKI